MQADFATIDTPGFIIHKPYDRIKMLCSLPWESQDADMYTLLQRIIILAFQKIFCIHTADIKEAPFLPERM